MRAVALAVLLPCALTGCGTVTNLVPSPKGEWTTPPALDDTESDQMLWKAYGGVKNDLWCIRYTWQASGPVMPIVRWVVCPIMALDVPVSFVGDTLTLPATVPFTVVNAINTFQSPYNKVFLPGWRNYFVKRPSAFQVLSERQVPDAKSPPALETQ